MSIPSPNLAETQKVLQEIRDLPATLLKLAFDLRIPTDCRNSIWHGGGDKFESRLCYICQWYIRTRNTCFY